MRTKESQLTVNGRVVLVQRKRIKNMYLRVDPQTGWLKVSVPRLTPDTAIIGFVRGREEWIERRWRKQRNGQRSRSGPSRQRTAGPSAQNAPRRSNAGSRWWADAAADSPCAT